MLPAPTLSQPGGCYHRPMRLPLRLPVALTAALLLALATLLPGGCGDDEKRPATGRVTASPSAGAGEVTTYDAKTWGFSLNYDAGTFRLESTESTSSLPLSASLFTGRELELRDLKTFDVGLTRTHTDNRAAAPGVSVTAQRLAHSSGAEGVGLARHALDVQLAELGRVWDGALWDEPQASALGGSIDAFTVDAVGYDQAAASELHVRLTVATLGRFLYTVREYAPRDQWDDAEPELAAIVRSVRLEQPGDMAGLQPRSVRYENARYTFSLELPAAFPVVSQAKRPTPDLQFGAQFCDFAVSPLVAVAVGVAEAPEGIGNSQSRLLETFYRDAAEQLRDEPAVVQVRQPKAVKLNGGTAWVIDVTRRQADGSELRTRTYDIWHNSNVYSVIARGRAADWQADWKVLGRIVASFHID